MGTTKAQVEIEFSVNQIIKNDVDVKRKFQSSEITKERQMGLMVEERVKLQKCLDKNKMTFDELLISLKK
jgi:hypothetical protein